MRPESGGFTLIELMIVVAIVAVLSAVAIPQFNEYRAKSSDATAKSDVATSIRVLAVDLVR